MFWGATLKIMMVRITSYGQVAELLSKFMQVACTLLDRLLLLRATEYCSNIKMLQSFYSQKHEGSDSPQSDGPIGRSNSAAPVMAAILEA
jgi:hypothetical protein